MDYSIGQTLQSSFHFLTMLVFESVFWLSSFLLVSSFLPPINAVPSPSRFARQSPRDPCPTQCGPSGASPANWTVYHDLDTLNLCKRPLLLDFVLGVPLDQINSSPRIRACSVWGDPVSSSSNTTISEQQTLATNGTLERIQLEGASSSSRDAARALSHVQKYVQSAPSTTGNSVVFAR
jgi:hypothetical protein